jgi:peptidoglycan DL-endopeptidase CwlO
MVWFSLSATCAYDGWMRRSIARFGQKRIVGSVILTLCIAAPVFTQSAFTTPAFAQNSIAAKRREASRLNDQIEATAARLEALNEDFLVATDRLTTLQKRLVRAERSEAKSTKRIAELRLQLRAQGLQVFTNPASSSIEALQDTETIADLERKLAIGGQRTQRLADAADLLRAQRADNERSTKQLAGARQEASRAKATLASKRKAADALFDSLQLLEKQVSGDLAGLIEADRKAKEAAEQRRVEQAAKRAKDAARAQLTARRTAERDALLRRRNGKSTKPNQPVKPGQLPKNTPAVAQGRENRAVARSIERATSTPTQDATDETPVLPDPPAVRPSNAKELRSLDVEAGVVEVGGSPGAQRAVTVAMSQIGKPYIWAAEGPNGYDCSGLMLYAWRAGGRSLPHSSRIQFSTTVRVPLDQRRPGDLLFYGHPIHHVGMYIGNDQMVEAPHRGALVRVKSIFRRDMVGVGRVSG